jgi:chemotaxis protein CheD
MIAAGVHAALAPSRTCVLHPGGVACGDSGARFETLLGSCVAIVLTDPRRTVGAICHVVHANAPHDAAGVDCAYGEHALAAMYGMLRARAINPKLCEAFLYGGGNMFPFLFDCRHPGDSNVRWARSALDRDGIRLTTEDVGGATYRRLSWTVGAGMPVSIGVPV